MNPKRNSEGYLDLTAYEAMNNIDEKEMVRKLLLKVSRICERAGYRVEGRITLRNKKSGKVWR